jgi:hypothetical protein
MTESKTFFLGGYDLEMHTIRELLEAHHYPFVDRQLQWGAKASAYQVEIENLPEHTQAVLIELEDDLGLGERALHIDHHNERAGHNQPTSLEQVFALLELPDSAWTRHFSLVSANDRGYIPAMQALGASRAEIECIRKHARELQRISPQQEREALQAIHERTTICAGKVIFIDLPHSKTSAVMDRLFWIDDRDTLILSPDESNFYGRNEVVRALYARYQGWSGGNLPKRGFWGMSARLSDVASLCDMLP